MRIAWVVPGGVDRTGEVRVIPCLLALIRRLAANHELHVFALRQEPQFGRYELLGATVHNMGVRWSIGRLATSLMREHRDQAFDIFHVFWGGKHSACVALLARSLRRPMILHLAGGELISLPDISYGGQRSWGRRLIMRISLRHASSVTAASPPVVAEGSAMGVDIESVVLGVDLDAWPVRAPAPRAENTPARLIHIGTLNRIKDQRTLLHAMRDLRDLGCSFHMTVVGADTLNGEMQALAQSLALESHVSFRGFLPHRELRPVVEQSDLLVLSSRHEGGEVVTLEAAVAGVPTVGTDVGHVHGLAPSGAVSVPVSDSKHLAVAIDAILRDEPRRLALAREAQRFATSHDADATAARFLSMYSEWTKVAGRRSKPTGVAERS